jgi:hypothetical protein
LAWAHRICPFAGTPTIGCTQRCSRHPARSHLWMEGSRRRDRVPEPGRPAGRIHPRCHDPSRPPSGRSHPLTSVREQAEAWECSRLYLTSEPDNAAAHATWLSFGFVNVPGDRAAGEVSITSNFKRSRQGSCGVRVQAPIDGDPGRSSAPAASGTRADARATHTSATAEPIPSSSDGCCPTHDRKSSTSRPN